STLDPAGTSVDVDGRPRDIDDPAVADSGAGPAPRGERAACAPQAPPPPACPADLNASGSVDASDLAVLLNNWAGSGIGDLDGSGTVDAADLAALLNAWGACP
ncbi:MAG: GC-type dockerin domain-anchored protein, partial [bacterium]